MVEPAIEARGLSAGYGPQPVVHDLQLEVRPGEVVALLGPNGAGKTTTLLALAGELPLLAGHVAIDGRVTTAPLYKRAQQGLVFVTEEKSVFMGLTTRDNLKVADVALDDALALFPELERRLDVRGGLLSGGEQQMLSLARALCRKPHVLLADELSMGLAPMVVTRLLQAVARRRRQPRCRSAAGRAARAPGAAVRRPGLHHASGSHRSVRHCRRAAWPPVRDRGQLPDKLAERRPPLRTFIHHGIDSPDRTHHRIG